MGDGQRDKLDKKGKETAEEAISEDLKYQGVVEMKRKEMLLKSLCSNVIIVSNTYMLIFRFLKM